MTAILTAPSEPVARKRLTKINDDVEFLSHQVEGIRDMARMTSFLLADDMGLGKTVQALAVAAIDFQHGYAKRILVVCPASLKDNWVEDEIADKTSFTWHVLSGTVAQRTAQLATFDADILVAGYEQVVSHLDQLNAMSFDIVIVDEAHNIKGYKSKRSKAVRGLVAQRFFLLTGSPMLNRPDELWALLNRIDLTTYSKYWSFVTRYCNTPEAPVWMGDLSFKPIGKVQVGDQVMGWRRVGGRRSFEVATVERMGTRVAPDVIRVTMESGRFVRCTPDHLWLTTSHGGYSKGTARVDHDNFVPIIQPGPGQPVTALSSVIEPPPALPPELQRQADWLAGMIDGEGGGSATISQSLRVNPAVHARIGEVLDNLGIDYRKHANGYDLRGGRQTFVNLLNWTDVVKRSYFTKRVLMGNRVPQGRAAWTAGVGNVGQMNRTKDRIVSIEHEGPGEVVSMQTTTGNYIVWGYASKNCVFGGYGGKQVVGVKNAAELRENLHAVMIRRLKKDVLDLPEKQHIKVKVGMSPEQAAMYREAMDELKVTLPGNPDPMTLENGMTKFLRLKQICGTTACFPGHADSSAKLDEAVDRAVQLVENGERVVAFTQFRQVLACFAARLRKAGVPVWEMHGDVPQGDRKGVVNEWTESEKPGVIVGMFSVAGVGFNMTAARTVFLLDKLYQPKFNEQAEDRCHRIGADKSQPVQVYEFICRHTAEERIERIISGKVKLNNEIIETTAWRRELYQAVMEEED